MKPKQRMDTALNHQSGQVPIDFGGCTVTGIHCRLVGQLRDYYGLQKRPVKIIEPYQMLGAVDDDLKDVIGSDTARLAIPTTMFGFDNVDWKAWQTPWGQDVLVAGLFNTTVNEKGDLLIYPEGDLSVPPSGKMPEGGDFFDTIIRQEPIDNDKLNPEDNLEEFKPISAETLDFLKAEVEDLQDSDRFIFGDFGGTGLGDIALVPGPFMKHPKGIRDIAEWYMSMVGRQDYIHAVFSRQIEIALENLAKVYEVVGDLPGIVYICGTDFGTQTSTFCSPNTYKTLYDPHYKKINGWIHEHTPWKTFKHCCGAVETFMDLFIDSGFDAINPVQCSATGMDPQILKERYGDRLVFWGGGVDTQKTLPFGTPEEVRTEVLSRCEIFSVNGGYVFNAIHNVLPNTPVENFVAMVDAVKEFNGTS